MGIAHDRAAMVALKKTPATNEYEESTVLLLSRGHLSGASHPKGMVHMPGWVLPGLEAQSTRVQACLIYAGALVTAS